ncbi:MAG: hypothetical protein KDC35_16725 [Acidobacteria bacterium]|nr:hypothetical protein [Acidobacteriota bacterium]
MKPSDLNILLLIKWLHTLVWVFFVGCIVAIPICAFQGKFVWAVIWISVVFGEVVILLINRWKCPLTSLASQYTDASRANFDIFLPEWLARHNKSIFGTLYLVGVCITVVCWVTKT